MEVVKRIIADVLYRSLGNYVDGLTKESIGNGVWEGNLELRGLRLRAEALAVLFESLGLDLPVTVTAGYIGLLCVEVPWTSLQSVPVRIILTDVAVVASPVSDGEQTELERREKRLKAARLATDEALREVRFSMRNTPTENISGNDEGAEFGDRSPQQSSSLSSRLGLRRDWWKRFITRIVDNIQIEITNVIVQYEDASSVRGRPYTCSLALDSLKASAADSNWEKVFLGELSLVLRKVVQLEGLVLNWEPGIEGNELRKWIHSAEERTPGQWAGFVRSCKRHAIKPMSGELRMSVVKPRALAEALASKSSTLNWLKTRPRVEMDLHIPGIEICLDDFNYHTLLSTIMYLSDIDRRVRPTTAKGRWQWAVDRLLPRFKERRKSALLLHDPDLLRQRRELREAYCKARNSLVIARRNGRRENLQDVLIAEKIESEESVEDIILFRDIADRLLRKESQLSKPSSTGWSLWAPWRRSRPEPPISDDPESVLDQSDLRRASLESSIQSSKLEGVREGTTSTSFSNLSGAQARSTDTCQLDNSSIVVSSDGAEIDIGSIPRVRMAFLMERGCIQLSRGGFVGPPEPTASLEFRELRLGITTAAATGFLLEAVLGKFEAIDRVNGAKVMYVRVPRTQGFRASEPENGFSGRDSDSFDLESKVIGSTDSARSDQESFKNTTDRSYPSDVLLALKTIRKERSDEELLDSSSFTLSKQEDGAGFSAAQLDKVPSSFEYVSDHVDHDKPLKYIAALRISQESSSEISSEESEATRLAMDLSIGGMEVILDGPDCAFIFAVSFWSPREKMPSIMSFLSRSAAPKLAFLRMEVQKALLDRKSPMRMDLHIRAPRLIIAPAHDTLQSVVVDLGTFAMETSTTIPEPYSIDSQSSDEEALEVSDLESMDEKTEKFCEIQYTDYRMTCRDLGVFIITKDESHNAEQLVKPFALNLVLRVLHNPAFLEAMTNHVGRIDLSKVKLDVTLSALHTTVTHKAFRQVLAVAKAWSSRSDSRRQREGIYHSENGPRMLQDDDIEDISVETGLYAESIEQSSLISFEMYLELPNLNLELLDSSSRRIVTISSTGTIVRLKRRPGIINFSYLVHSFIVVDGSRGATAPYRRLAYAGSDGSDSRLESSATSQNGSTSRSSLDEEEKAFISVCYTSDLRTHEQSIDLQVLSLHLVCVRETYLVLADFFYLVESSPRRTQSLDSKSDLTQSTRGLNMEASDEMQDIALASTQVENEYSDPLNAFGLTTVGAARKIRETANIGMEMSKQALANRGKLVVTANLDGVAVVLVSGEGAIASFQASDFTSRLEQMPVGSVEASGQLGGFEVKDLTAAYEVYSKAVHYNRPCEPDRNVDVNEKVDGWTLRIPEKGGGNSWLSARLRNLNVVYLQRFVIILKKYVDVLRENLRPILEMKGGIAEVFDDDLLEDLSALAPRESRLRLDCITENINIIMPRHSQSPHEALRFVIGRSSVTNEDEAAPGYSFGLQIATENVKGFVLYDANVASVGEAAPLVSVRPVDPLAPTSDISPFTEDVFITSKIDLWRRRRVPQVVLNEEGIPVLKKGEGEREYDPNQWRPTIRVRICAQNGLNAILCEAQYSILYFCFTENVIERPDIEFTDIVRGLKTPVLPPRRPIRPIMLSSHRMPPNYQILFEVPSFCSTILHGGDPIDSTAKLVRVELCDIVGSFEYGVDYRMSVEVSGSVHSVVDIRPHAIRPNAVVISSARLQKSSLMDSSKSNTSNSKSNSLDEITDDNRSITITWDRPYGYRANVMVVVSDLRIIVVPELFRDLGLLTGPGFPYLKSSAPAPFLRFNGRQLILTVSRPEIWLMAHQYAGDGRSLVLRGELIAKVQWAAVTGRNTLELAAHGLNINLSSKGPIAHAVLTGPVKPPHTDGIQMGHPNEEVPLLYPSDISLMHHGSGYDPPTSPGGEPTKAPGSELEVNAESFLLRVDVNDIPLILAIGSRLARLRPSVLSVRPLQPGRFDEWIDKGDDGGARLFASVSLPHARLIFTYESAGHYIPIMELRVGSAIVRSNVPWVTNAQFEFSVDLFNDEKGWWEPGVEPFPFEVAVARGKSGSEAIHLRTDETIDANITPTTVSGAFRVAKTLKHAIEDLIKKLKTDIQDDIDASGEKPSDTRHPIADVRTEAQRPSVAAFCVKNNIGRAFSLWLPYDSMRRNLRGNGQECEIAMPTEDLLWSAVSCNPNNSAVGRDGTRDRHITMQCMISISGYDPLPLSVAEVGTQIVHFFPEASPNRQSRNHSQKGSTPGVLTLVWTVFMRNGVPVGCLRSLYRLVNRTRTSFHVKIGQSYGDTNNHGGPASSSSRNLNQSSQSTSSSVNNGTDPVLIKPGESWSVPIHAVERTICIRPVILHAPDTESRGYVDGYQTSSKSGRVYYSYQWSDPLSKFSSLLSAGMKLQSIFGAVNGSKSKRVLKNVSLIPSLSCRSVQQSHPFTCLMIPHVDSSASSDLYPHSGKPKQWLDIIIRAPFVFSNALPRPISFVVASSKQVSGEDRISPLAKGWIEPLRSEHVHSAGTDTSRLSVGIGYSNSPITESASSKRSAMKKARSIPEVHKDLSSVERIPVGDRDDGMFMMKIDRAMSVPSQQFTLYSDFWIRNRSSIDLLFKNADSARSLTTANMDCMVLRSRPPGTPADNYIAFSGPWVSFRTVFESAEWKPLSSEISEIDRPVSLNLHKVSLMVEVRPARGEFQRTLIVTIRNAMWIENKTDVTLQWCQPAALDNGGNALLSNVHTAPPGSCVPLHWDFEKDNKAVCLRRAESNGSSDWIWSRPIRVDRKEGEFSAKMYCPKKYEQYCARIVVSRLAGGVGAIIIHPEDRTTPAYRIMNLCKSRSIAFRQRGVQEKRPWLVLPGKSTRYSWDDPQSPLARRSLVVEVVEPIAVAGHGVTRSLSTGALDPGREDNGSGTLPFYEVQRAMGVKEVRYPTFNLNIDILQDYVEFRQSKRFHPVSIEVHLDGPTKVVAFSDVLRDGWSSSSTKIENGRSLEHAGASKPKPPRYGETREIPEHQRPDPSLTKNLDVKIWIKSLGLSFVDDSPVELAYLCVAGIQFRMDRFDGQQLVQCEVRDVQLDNQLPHAAWPVVLWSPPAHDHNSKISSQMQQVPSHGRTNDRKPFFELTIDGEYPHVKNGIAHFRGVFVALQQLRVAADEDFVVRVWTFSQSLLAATGEIDQSLSENLSRNDGLETGLSISTSDVLDEHESDKSNSEFIKRLYVTNLELCPLKLTVSFTSSRTSTAAARVRGFRSFVRTIVAVFGNVENAEFRFNALELKHVFDSVAHFRSLIAEFYISQGASQKMTLLTSNSLIGNPSALFDSIAIGAKDFFVEPAKAKSSGDFIVGIGRGSHSLLTNTVGGLVGSIGEIPRAVAHGLETAVGDKEYLAERESIRGGRTRAVSSPAQGLISGALSFGHGIASGATGLIRDPLQGAVEEGPSGFMRGLRKGVIGGVLKPITGALDLIAEPAAGIRNLMVSERSKSFAEPNRPSRTFLSVHRDRLWLYDLKSALGSAILHAVIGIDNDADERLVTWVHFTEGTFGTDEKSTFNFLWALVRRSTRSPNTARGQLADSHGVIQRAEKIRVGLITSKRVIVTSLDGRVIWERPLMDVIDTQASLESREYLSVGVRPAGCRTHNVVAPTWERVHCGTALSRDKFNSSLKKVLSDLGLTRARQRAALLGTDSNSFAVAPGSAMRSFEMIDLSSENQKLVKCDENSTHIQTELKALHSDASVDGRRGIFTAPSLPGRKNEKNRARGDLTSTFSVGISSGSDQDDLSRRIANVMNETSDGICRSVRYVRVIVVNRLKNELRLIRATMESGEWACDVPISIPSSSVVVLEAHEPKNRIKDVSGSFVYQVCPLKGETLINNSTIALVALRFVNSMLASNAYAVNAPNDTSVSRLGGEKGDRAQTVISISRSSEHVPIPKASKPMKLTTYSEPLLFGRDELPPVIAQIKPPHISPSGFSDPDDPVLIQKLSSLGFPVTVAQEALRLENGNLAKAYARLAGMSA